jgi:nucleotide-binding universal stress UspA family protein
MEESARDRQRKDPRPVVVGVDTSDRARVAALWAAVEASLRAVELHLVHSRPPTPRADASDLGSLRGTAGPAAQHLLHSIARACNRAVPGLVVRTHLEMTPAVSALVRWSSKAQLLAVGHRGTSEFTGVMVGSVCTAVAERARCPVAVVRGPEDSVPAHSGPVVLGLSGSRSDEAVVEFGFAAAERGHCPVIAVRNWWTELDDDFLIELFELGSDVEGHLARIQDEVARVVERSRRDHPEVALTIRVVHERPAPTLLDEAERNRPQLLVLAAHDRDVPERFLGPTARTLLHHADCPVAIVDAVRQPLRPQPARATATRTNSPG